jgi:hypothetical protein
VKEISESECMRDWRGRDRERKQENIKDTDQEINKKIKLFRMK